MEGKWQIKKYFNFIMGVVATRERKLQLGSTVLGAHLELGCTSWAALAVRALELYSCLGTTVSSCPQQPCLSVVKATGGGH